MARRSKQKTVFDPVAQAKQILDQYPDNVFSAKLKTKMLTILAAIVPDTPLEENAYRLGRVFHRVLSEKPTFYERKLNEVMSMIVGFWRGVGAPLSSLPDALMAALDRQGLTVTTHFHVRGPVAPVKRKCKGRGKR